MGLGAKRSPKNHFFERLTLGGYKINENKMHNFVFLILWKYWADNNTS